MTSALSPSTESVVAVTSVNPSAITFLASITTWPPGGSKELTAIPAEPTPSATAVTLRRLDAPGWVESTAVPPLPLVQQVLSRSVACSTRHVWIALVVSATMSSAVPPLIARAPPPDVVFSILRCATRVVPVPVSPPMVRFSPEVTLDRGAPASPCTLVPGTTSRMSDTL